MEKLAPECEYVESMVEKNRTIVFYTETSFLVQTMKKLRRKRRHQPSQKGSQQRLMRVLIQQQCMLQNNRRWPMRLFYKPYQSF